MDDEPAEKTRVAIVGGGCAGMAAAWALSAHPDLDVHVYEKSWRLGGKGASVRADDGRILEHGLHVWLGFYDNAFRMMRECYSEVERRGWGPHGDAEQKLSHGRIEDAFYPEPHAGVADPAHGGDWAFWSGLFPAVEGMPGEPIDERNNPFTLPNYLTRVFQLLKTLMQSVVGPAGLSVVEAVPAEEPGAVTALVDRMAAFVRVGALTGAAALVQAISILEVWLRDYAPASEPQSRRLFDSARQLVEAVAAQVRKTLADLAAMDPEVRMRAEIIDIVMTIGAGLIREKILFDPRGLDAINDVDYRDWLKRNGATDVALKSRFLVGAYDFVFGYRNGDRNDPQLAAGIALRGAFRMFFTYRGAMVWRMASGMGDVVFAPLYKVLQEGRELPQEKPAEGGQPVQRRMSAPVTFHFLHELESVRFDRGNGDKRFVTSLNFRTHGPAAALDAHSRDALDDFGHWPKSPEAKFAGALARGVVPTTKAVAKDFHRVILALGLDDLAETNDGRMAEALGPDAFAAWDRMMKTTGTVATKAAQVWLRADPQSLGWNRGAGVITALGRSFSSWGDMSVTLASERGRSGADGAPQRARSVHYFCDVMADDEIGALRRRVADHGGAIKRALTDAADALRSQTAEDAANPRSLEGALRTLVEQPLPKPLHGAADKVLRRLFEAIARLGADPDRHAVARLVEDALQDFDEHLFDAAVKRRLHEQVDALLTREMREAWPRAFADGRTAIDVEVARHVQANLVGSERYTQSLPGTIADRVSPLDRSAENMTVAGDWTACGLDMGCVEAAVMSGLLAAHATSGTPERHTIIGFDHP